MNIINSIVIWFAGSDRDISINIDNEDKISLVYTPSCSGCGPEGSKLISVGELLNLLESTDLKQFNSLMEKVSKLEIENKALKSKLGRLNHIIERIKTFKLDYDE